MKCQNCDGNGRFEVEDNGVVMQVVYWRCPNCGGKGIVEPLTNEEWFCQLPTTKKSEFLSAMVKQAIKVYEIHGVTWHETVSWWDGWLKEKHK